LLLLPSIGSNKNKRMSSQPRQVGRPQKAKNKGKPAIDPPVPSQKSHPKHRSVPLEPDSLSAENESDAILAATEGLLGLSRVGKTHDGGASDVKDSNGSSTLSVDGGGVAIDINEDDETSKSSNSDGEEEDEGKLFVSSVMMMD
jgi:hypothetical protein